jgi:hypothetical protein
MPWDLYPFLPLVIFSEGVGRENARRQDGVVDGSQHTPWSDVKGNDY